MMRTFKKHIEKKSMFFVSSFSQHGFFVDTRNRLLGFGRNECNQLGIFKEFVGQVDLEEVKFFSGKKIVFVGVGKNFSVFETDVKIYVTGSNKFGQLAQEKTFQKSSQILEIKQFRPKDLLCIACGHQIMFFVTKKNEVFGVGSNASMVFGEEESKSQTDFVKINFPGNDPIYSVECGEKHAVFFSLSNRVYVTRRNSYGESGYGYKISSVNFPAEIPFFSSRGETFPRKINVVKFRGGCAHSLFLDDEGNVYACGEGNYGQIGDGTRRGSSEPKKMKEKYTDIVSGCWHNFFIRDGKIFSCGDIANGKTGIKKKIEEKAIFYPIELDCKLFPDFVEVYATREESYIITKNAIFGTGKRLLDGGSYKEFVKVYDEPVKMIKRVLNGFHRKIINNVKYIDTIIRLGFS